MIDLQTTYAGPKLHKIENNHPNDVLVRLIEENPQASRDVIENLVIGEIEEDDVMRRVALRYWFLNHWNALYPRRTSVTQEKLRPESMKQAVAKNVQRVTRVVLSDLMMPNGKKLADCTGTEMTKFGGFYAEIGRRVGRKKVGAVLSEDQLWKLRQDGKR